MSTCQRTSRARPASPARPETQCLLDPARFVPVPAPLTVQSTTSFSISLRFCPSPPLCAHSAGQPDVTRLGLASGHSSLVGTRDKPRRCRPSRPRRTQKRAKNKKKQKIREGEAQTGKAHVQKEREGERQKAPPSQPRVASSSLPRSPSCAPVALARVSHPLGGFHIQTTSDPFPPRRHPPRRHPPRCSIDRPCYARRRRLRCLPVTRLRRHLWAPAFPAPSSPAPTRSAKMAPTSAQQKILVAQFTTVTGASERQAAKVRCSTSCFPRREVESHAALRSTSRRRGSRWPTPSMRKSTSFPLWPPTPRVQLAVARSTLGSTRPHVAAPTAWDACGVPLTGPAYAPTRVRPSAADASETYIRPESHVCLPILPLLSSCHFGVHPLPLLSHRHEPPLPPFLLASSESGLELDPALDSSSFQSLHPPTLPSSPK